MPEIIDENTLRKKMKQKRNALTWEERERAAEDCLRQLKQVPGFEQVTWMYCYMSYLSELDTRQMIQSFLKEGKRVAVPKVQGAEMEFYEISDLSDCVSGAYGIPEPIGNAAPVTDAGWILMPGLAFDPQGNRLGYGGGFYDKYLEKHDNLVKIALAYDFQIISSVSAEIYDKPVDYIVTPERILKTK